MFLTPSVPAVQLMTPFRGIELLWAALITFNRSSVEID
jgi:hypothetical protein